LTIMVQMPYKPFGYVKFCNKMNSLYSVL